MKTDLDMREARAPRSSGRVSGSLPEAQRNGHLSGYREAVTHNKENVRVARWLFGTLPVVFAWGLGPGSGRATSAVGQCGSEH